MVARLRQFPLVDQVAHGRALEELVAADVVDVQVRVDEHGHVAEPEPALLQLPRDRLLLGLLRELERKHAVHVVEVDPGVEQEQPLVVSTSTL